MLVRNDNRWATNISIPQSLNLLLLVADVRELFHCLLSIVVVPTIIGFIVRVPIVVTVLNGNQRSGMEIFPLRCHRFFFLCSSSYLVCTFNFPAVESVLMISAKMLVQLFLISTIELAEGTCRIAIFKVDRHLRTTRFDYFYAGWLVKYIKVTPIEECICAFCCRNQIGIWIVVIELKRYARLTLQGPLVILNRDTSLRARVRIVGDVELAIKALALDTKVTKAVHDRNIIVVVLSAFCRRVGCFDGRFSVWSIFEPGWHFKLVLRLSRCCIKLLTYKFMDLRMISLIERKGIENFCTLSLHALVLVRH